MKECPFCAEDIQDKAVKCKHCNEWLPSNVSTEVPTNEESSNKSLGSVNNQSFNSGINVKGDKQIIVLVLGLATSVLTGIMLSVINLGTGIAIYSFMLLGIVPVGAILSGLVASCGFYFGAKHYCQKPVGGLLFNMIVAAVGTYFIVKYIPYWFLEYNGTRIKDSISFISYLDYEIRSISLTMIRGSATGELGGWGYVYSLLQIIGFAIGGMGTFSFLSDIPYCDKCSLYIPDESYRQVKFHINDDLLQEQLLKFNSIIDSGDLSTALKYHLVLMGDDENNFSELRSDIVINECKTCNMKHMNFFLSNKVGEDWHVIDKTDVKLIRSLHFN